MHKSAAGKLVWVVVKATTRAPAAIAASTPAEESSNTMQFRGGLPSN
jgi:hypothetical protein